MLASDHSGQATARLIRKAAGVGEFYFRVRAFAISETGAYGITITDLGVDDFADEPALATTLTATSGTPVPGALQFDGDKDVVKLPLTAGHSYRFEAAWAVASTASLQLELIAPDRATVVLSSQQVAPKGLTRITSAGDYYLRIQEPTGKLRGAYTFTFTDLGVDDHGDAPPEASPVIIGGPPANGGFERPDDVDVFQFQAQAGHIYAFTCNPSGGAVDCQVSLSDAAGTVLATDNNGGTGYVVYEYTQAGTYYFRVSSGAVGTYTYRLEDLGFDDYGDTRATATLVTPVATATPARIEVPGDVDFLKFSVEADRIYTFTCASSAFPCAVELQDEAGAVLESGTASSGSVKLVHTFTAAGTAYARIVSSTAGATGSYTWMIESKHVDDHGNTIDTATPITAGGGVLNGSLEEVGDLDVFRFTATAGHIYRFTCDSTVLDCDVELLGATGAVLLSATGPETPAILTAELTTGGTYYFRVQTDGSATGAYTYSLEDLGVDDHGDTSATATPLTAPVSGTGKLEIAGDVDVFSFSGLLDEVYTFTCTGTSVDCNVLLVDSNGTTVASDTSASADASITYRLPRAGTWYLHVKSTPTATGTYGYQLVSLGTDEHGDTLPTATPVVVGAPATGGRIDTSTDVDVFSFSALAGHIYEITCTSANLSCDLRLMNAAGSVLASNSGANARVAYEVGPAGTYYFSIASATSTAGTYTYQIVDLGVDDHGDTIATATPIAAGAPAANGTLELPGDVDVFSFSATAEHLNEFTCASTTIDCNVELLHATGTVLAADNSSSKSALVRLQLVTAGTYYVRVTGGSAGNPTGTYSYQLRDLGLDDHGDTTGSATPVTPGAPPANGKINSATDVDLFSFDATAGHIYQFTCAATAFDCNVALMNAAGAVLASDTGPATSALVVFEFTAGGTYYYKVSSGNGALGSYTYELQDLGVDDHGDTQATATPIAPSSTGSTGRIETPGDWDVFSFAATAGHIYRFTCTGAAGDCDADLVDGSGTVLAQDVGPSSLATLLYEIGPAGPYYVRLRFGNASTTTIGNYTYQLEDLGVDDHGDTQATATLITPSTTSSTGRVETLGDVDFFRFASAANTTYEFSCSSTAIDCNVVLYDANGVVLQQDTGSSTSAKVTYVVRTASTFYVKVYSGTAAIGDYTYQLKDLGTDDHGNTIDNATPVTPSSAFSTANIEAASDVDVFSFTALAGHIYEIECTSTSFDCDLVLMNAAGTVIASDKTSSSTARVRVELATVGTYYFQIQPGTAAFGSYSYRLQDLGVDDFGDTDATATPITVMASSAPGQIETAGDYDVFSFTATAGHIYEFSCTGSAGDCDLALVDSSGTVLIQDTAPSSSAKILYEVGPAGTYYVRLWFGDASTTVIGGYSYQLKDLGVDDHGDTQATATLITPSATSSTGRVETLGDVDFFRFAGAANTTYEFSCSSTAIDCNVVLYDSSGTVVLSDTGASTSAKVTYLVRTAATFYVKVYSGTATLGDYTYQLKNLGTDDHGNTIDNATPVTPSSSYSTAKIDAASDVDVFSFTALAGHIYEVECSTTAFDCNLLLLDSTGATIASDTATALSAKVRVELNVGGTYYFQIQPGTSTFGTYSYRVQDLGVDDFGDTDATANPITVMASSAPGQIETAGDQDVFSFTATAGHIYEFSCTGSAGDCDLALADSSGTVLFQDTAPSSTAKILYEVGPAGTYYVRLHFGNASTTVIGGYSYQLKDLGVDDHGDTQATATPITPSSTSSTGRVETLGDLDHFSFAGAANTTYEFSCSSSAIDCNLVLYDSSGTVVQSDTGASTSAKLTYLVRVAGTFYVRVYSGTATAGDYTYQLKNLGTDDHGNTLADATPVTPSSTFSNAKIDAPSDVDVFSFSAGAGHIYEIECSATAFDCNLVLMDSAGTVLAQDTSTSTSAKVRVKLTTEGTYFFRIQPGSSAFGTYAYRLQDFGTDDHGDTLATATPIVPSTTSTPAQFELAGDSDFFSFAAEANHIYEFTCGPSASLDCNAYLYNPSGTLLTQDTATSNSAKIRIKLTTAGTYYLRAYANTWNSTNYNYAFQLLDVGADDHGDTIATATPIMPSTTAAPAKFEVDGDSDFFSFAAEAGHIYEFSCVATGLDCNAFLYNASGTLVAQDTASAYTAKVRVELSTAGTYYLRAYANFWSSSNYNYTFQLQDLGVDDYGDTIATATPIMPSTTSTSAQFEVDGDSDFFSFVATANHVYEFTCVPSQSLPDCDAFLYNASGTLLAQDTSASNSAKIRIKLSSAGTYYLRAYANYWTSANVNYTFQLQDVAVDDHGDTIATATPIVPSTTATPAQFELQGDSDFFSFAGEANHVYEFTCVPAASLDCDAFLYNAAGTVLIQDNSGSLTAKVRIKLSTAGTYYLRAYASSWSSTNFNYTFQLQDVAVDDFGDTIATATPIVPSTTSTPARFEVVGDSDFFSFAGEANHIYEFTCVPAASLDCDAFLYNASGTLIISDTASSTTAKVRFKLSSAGTYYLRAYANSWNSTNFNYTFQLQDFGTDDHGDTIATATPIVPSTTSTPAQFEVTGDSDFFSFAATAGHIYEFSCVPGASLDCDAFVYNASGTLIVSDTTSATTARVRVELATAGTYYLRAYANTWNSTNFNYAFQLQDLGLDDHSDTATGATVISLGSTVPGNLETSGDADFFAVDLAASTSYTVTTTGITTTIGVYGPDKTTLISSGSSPRTFTSAAVGGTHYVRVTSSTTGAYTVKVQ